MILIVIVASRSRVLDKELNSFELLITHISDHRVLVFLNEMIIPGEVLNKLLDHGGWYRGPVPRVLEDERPWILPVCLETYFLSRSTCMNCSIQQRHSTWVCSQFGHFSDQSWLVLMGNHLRACHHDRLLDEDLQPFHRPTVSWWSVGELTPGVELRNPKVSIAVHGWKQGPPNFKPRGVSKPHLRNNEPCSNSFPIDLGLPRDTKQSFVLHDQVFRTHVDRIIESERCENHTQDPPDENSSC